ncbi:TetR family transcriptional regulator [Sphaerimonospora thailandensis]|uniref:Putative transcriptional regulator, TetR family protein n=1 Tax=Sphaerimonospora thailandensis TaxID=795644 RepID=A0A8J3RB07_9ACTN|nr:TetR family transcriptional regulator [Sphaerimonospora thailandensis]GIH71369.1 putative transcriptional regulator, TetR family protein [Sphaerimonospora thailandensis]
MPRIAEARPPAEPSSPEQRARHVRILRAASHMAAERGLERVQMHEVAKAAGVAIGTLYRYFPSKTHLFTAVMAEQVDRFSESAPRPRPGTSPEDAVGELLVNASRQLLRRPALATAMLQSANAANAAAVADAGRIDNTFRDVVLRTLGIETPTAMDVTLVRLLMQCWYGVLQMSLNGRMAISDMESDVRLASRLLLAPRSNA